MLREQGNLIDENIPITKELIEFAYANNYKISLKTGDYYRGEFRKDAFNYNINLLSKLNDLYCVGDFYIGVYGVVFGFKKSDRWREVLRNNRLSTITGKESRELYKAHTDVKRTETNIELYGAAFPFQSPEIQAKCKQTCLLRYGSICPLNNPEIYAKAVATWLKNWGVDNPLKSEIIKLKIENTNVERYGYKSPLMSPEIRAKIAEIWMKNWGVDNPFKSEEVQVKIRETIRIRYGNCPFADPEIYAKAVATWVENWGVSNPMKSAEVREHFTETMIARYDVPYAMMSEELKQRLIDNNITNYGVPWAMMLPSVRGQTGDDDFVRDRYRTFISLKDGDPNQLHNFMMDAFSKGMYYTYTARQGLREVNKKGPSRCENIFKRLLDDMGVTYEINAYKEFMRHPTTRRLRELDFFIPEFNIAFEINGDYPHSVEAGVDEEYHRFKYEACSRAGIKLVSLTESDFKNIDFIQDVLDYHLNNIDIAFEEIDRMRLGLLDLSYYNNLIENMKLLPVGSYHHWYPVGGENAVSG
nr:MAG TPA: endonuclease-like protein [Caudoviricetes sp.]